MKRNQHTTSASRQMQHKPVDPKRVVNLPQKSLKRTPPKRKPAPRTFNPGVLAQLAGALNSVQVRQ